MADTPLGFAFPDVDDPVDVPASIQQAMESIDAYLTPRTETIALSTPFSNTLILTRIGPLVVLSGGVQRSGAPATGSVVIGNVPAGWEPPNEYGTIIGTVFGTSTTYQLLVRPNGEIAFRMSAATGSTMHVSLTWRVA